MPKRKKFHKHRYETFVCKGLVIPKRILAKRRADLEFFLARGVTVSYQDRAGYTFKLSWIVPIHQMVEEGLLEEIHPRKDRWTRSGSRLIPF
jgi:hypothetical protein